MEETMSKRCILTIDDEEHILELLNYHLTKMGYEVVQAGSGEEGLSVLGQREVDLVLLDLMLPGIDGLQVLRKIKENKKTKSIPVIMLTARSDEIDTVLGLEMGADDYIGKPFGVHELGARIKVVLRRNEVQSVPEENDDDLIIAGTLVINRVTHEVSLEGQRLELPLKEFELLSLLAKNKGRVFERDDLLEKIWGYDYYGETRTVDVHIRNLRKKIEKDDKNPEYIKTVRGVGYKFG